MSSSVSGKFQDHYIVLGVEPSADIEAIKQAYTRLADTLHPDNPETGDQKKFNDLNAAFEVLCDPALRMELDKIKGVDRDAGNPVFTGAVFFDALQRAVTLRFAILCILCDRRRLKPSNPTLSQRRVETMLQTTNDELNFVLWYLKQRGYVYNDDKSNLQITVEGMDYLESNPPAAEAVMSVIHGHSLTPVEQKPRSTTIQALNMIDRALRSAAPRVKI
jgi:curved DNA-binding protein